ncbi:hypothetical protein DXG01_000419 [Tephrocybe rancida]|nr:hypothetical protein DXG01_000419 [Tephrocybe rancida]
MATTYPIKVDKNYGGEPTGLYLVELKPNVDIRAFLQKTGIAAEHAWDFLHSFAAKLQPEQLTKLCNNRDVEAICEDVNVRMYNFT